MTYPFLPITFSLFLSFTIRILINAKYSICVGVVDRIILCQTLIPAGEQNLITAHSSFLFHCTQEKYEDKLDFYILDLLSAHL